MRFRSRQTDLDLNGEWNFAFTAEPGPRPLRSACDLRAAGLKVRPAKVPGSYELDLQAIGLLPPDLFHGTHILKLQDYENTHFWYFRTFQAADRDGWHAELLCEGLDCLAEVYLNGQLLGSTDNMLVEHAFPAKGLLAGENELLIHFRPVVEEARQFDYPPAVSGQTCNVESLYVRKAPHMFGWDIMPRALSAGLWRPVSLRYLPDERLEQVYLQTEGLAADGDRAQLALHYRARLHATPADRYELQLEGRCAESVFHERRPVVFEAGWFQFELARPKLWWPRGRGEAHLYKVTARLLKNGQELDAFEFAHGVRTVELRRTDVTDAAGSGEFCFYVNGERVFILGTNWVPADVFHARDVARIEPILALADELGCNMLRCWGGNVYENDLFFDRCDAAGLMVWQDFAMACGCYPQDDAFARRLEAEARQVVRRLRQHPSLVLWCGDNECDEAYGWGGRRWDPNLNRLTREVLPGVLRAEDPSRPYLPSSPYISPEAFRRGDTALPERHLWGPRDYYKSDYYRNANCHFASELGYHGCPDPASLREFLSPDKVWPWQDNAEWLLHGTSPVPSLHPYDYRIELMAKQVGELFGRIPATLDEFAFASQASQVEALKFFIEWFRGAKWRRTGLIWWNLIDGWPQFSDALVDYYFRKKLAYEAVRRCQQPLCLVLQEPQQWGQDLVACNDTRQAVDVTYRVTDVHTAETLAAGCGHAAPDSVTRLARIPFSASAKRFYAITWTSALGEGRSHYLAGHPPFDLAWYRAGLERVGLTGAALARGAGAPA